MHWRSSHNLWHPNCGPVTHWLPLAARVPGKVMQSHQPLLGLASASLGVRGLGRVSRAGHRLNHLGSHRPLRFAREGGPRSHPDRFGKPPVFWGARARQPTTSGQCVASAVPPPFFSASSILGIQNGLSVNLVLNSERCYIPAPWKWRRGSPAWGSGSSLPRFPYSVTCVYVICVFLLIV